MINTHYKRLRAKGLSREVAKHMADVNGEKAELRAAVFKYLFICACAAAIVVTTLRMAQAEASEKLASQAKQIEQLEYMISACQSTGGFHIDGSWHRCVLREVGK